MNRIGIVSEVSADRVKVAINTMVTDFLPVLQVANSFKREWVPLRVGEQVLVLPILGDLNAGVVIRSAYYSSHNAPHTQDNEQICLFEDGVSFKYNSKSSTLTISPPKEVNIICTKANLKAQTTTVTSPKINLIGNTLIQGSISTAGEGGSSGTFSINGNLNITGNLTTGGSIKDSRGDLTNHTNEGRSRD